MLDTDHNFWKLRVKARAVLERPERLSEVLFGLIMVLTFTGTISVSTAGRQDLRQLIWAALGCNLAWGIVDAIMYIMDTLIGRAKDINQLNKLRDAGSVIASREIVRNNITPLISDLMNDEEIDRLSEKMKKLPEPKVKSSMTIRDFLNAGMIFLLVFLSTFPVALPFILFQEVATAMRISNGVALLLLFAAGYSLARYSGLRPLITALVYAAIGVLLVLLTIFLGG